MNEKITAIEKLAQNPDFQAALAATENEAQMQQVFADFGVELSGEEITAMVKAMTPIPMGELDEAALENVSGGAIWNWIRYLPIIPLPVPRWINKKW